MSTLERWPDDYVLTRDPRREDPLFYYRQEGTWAEAVGFQVFPPYEESDAPEVSSRNCHVAGLIGARADSDGL